MLIKKLEISNFKSFKHLEIELNSFNLLVGPNAAGKSNFIQVFKFIRDIINNGLENAVSMQGGVEYLRNINLLNSQDKLNFKINIQPDEGFGIWRKSGAQYYKIEIEEFIYEFSLAFDGNEFDYKVEKDKLFQKFHFYKYKSINSSKPLQDCGLGEFNISADNGKFSVVLTKEQNIPLTEEDLTPALIDELQKYWEEHRSSDSLLIENAYLFMSHLESITRAIGGIPVYDFDPTLSKKATQFAGKAELEESGENLAIVLRKILADSDKKRIFFNYMNDVLPFVDNLDVEKFSDKALLLKLKEKYSQNQYLPASFISDGTISLTAIIFALYFDNKPVALFEEPERSIHPYLLSKLMDMFKDASEKKQLIISTHNPEMVRHIGFKLESLLLVSRDENGFTVISRPHEKKEVRTFLKNDIGIEELYVQNLLGS